MLSQTGAFVAQVVHLYFLGNGINSLTWKANKYRYLNGSCPGLLSSATLHACYQYSKAINQSRNKTQVFRQEVLEVLQQESRCLSFRNKQDITAAAKA